MSSSEALGEDGPRIKLKGRSRISKTIRNYFVVICTLFIIILLLCMNNLVIYRSYMNIRYQFNMSSKAAQVIMTDKQELNQDNQNLIKENFELKAAYNDANQQNQEILDRLQQLEKQYEELNRKNKELAEDNIALQNTLKMAASVGIKPQNYTKFNGVTSRGDFDREKYLGKFLGTAYTPSKEECGNNKGITNSGKPIVPGISIAVDSKHWPFGTVFYIKGLGYAVAMDTGSAIKGKNRFDFAVFDRDFAKTLGQKYWDVYLVKIGNGKIEDFKF